MSPQVHLSTHAYEKLMQELEILSHIEIFSWDTKPSP